jgi:MoxR-like ATPase
VKDLRSRVGQALAPAIVGHDGVVDLMLSSLVLGGHVLLEGVPGTAKSLLANAFARAIGGDYRRAQFTPDMLPSDLTGTMALRGGELAFRPGPVFTNVLLADEINRTPPKTQSALLEAMQERQVSVDGRSHPLPDPFLVIATQNPVEFEGTYPLPEAQLDRFLFQAIVGYPDEVQELAILGLPRQGAGSPAVDAIEPVIGTQQLAAARAELDATRVTGEVAAYIVAVARATRALPAVELGASPRATVHLLAASRAAARLAGREFVTPDDVAAMAGPVFAHRLVLTAEAELERYRPADAVAAALASVPVPR